MEAQGEAGQLPDPALSCVGGAGGGGSGLVQEGVLTNMHLDPQGKGGLQVLADFQGPVPLPPFLALSSQFVTTVGNPECLYVRVRDPSVHWGPPPRLPACGP